MDFKVWANGLMPGENPAPPSETEIRICETWLEKYCKPRKTFRDVGSYRLKHVVENWSKTYISNGAFIQASINLGYRIRPRKGNSYSAEFNISFPRRGTQEYYEAFSIPPITWAERKYSPS